LFFPGQYASAPILKAFKRPANLISLPVFIYPPFLLLSEG